MPSLNTTQPENVAHGSEIQIQAVGPGGGPVVIGEIFEMTYDEDNLMEKLPVFGSRRTGERRGRIDIKGTIKSYWLNSTSRSLWTGAAIPATGGAASAIYHSQIPFQRYNIVVVSLISGSPALTFINVTFGKDTVTWNADKLTNEDIAFEAEDIFGA